MPIACVHIDHFLLQVELLRQPHLRGTPLLIIDRSGPKKTVLDQSPNARDIHPGMRLDQALARCPQAKIFEADQSAYRSAWDRILDSLEQRSPIVEDADFGLAYIDLHGLDRLHGGEEHLLATILDSIHVAYHPRVGVANGKFPAYTVALSAAAGRARRAPEHIGSFLRPLPITLLPTSWEIKERLESFGLHSLGDVATLSFNAMQGAFGKEGARLWHLANGEDNTPLNPRSHDIVITQEISFVSPTVWMPTIVSALEGLLVKAFNDPRLRGRYARVVHLEAQVHNGLTWTRRVAFREPVGDKNRALLALQRNLARVSSLPGPLETLSATFSHLTGESARQESLFGDLRRQAQIDNAIRQLRAKLGPKPVLYQIREVEPWSRIPERRRVLVPYRG